MLSENFHPQSCRKKRSGSPLMSWHYWYSGPVQPAMDNNKRSTEVSCTLSDFVMVMVRTTLLMLSLQHFQIPNLWNTFRLPCQYIRHRKQVPTSETLTSSWSCSIYQCFRKQRPWCLKSMFLSLLSSFGQVLLLSQISLTGVRAILLWEVFLEDWTGMNGWISLGIDWMFWNVLSTHCIVYSTHL